IPSKTLRHAIFRMAEVNDNPLFAKAGISVQFDYPELLRSAEAVIQEQVVTRGGFYQRNQIPVFFGEAHFQDEHTLLINEPQDGTLTLTAEKFVIAVGSRPYRPADVDFSHPDIYDSDTILTMDRTPQSMTIYGAGVIGCEYASMFRRLGIKINLVNTRCKLLEYLDDEIIDALSYQLREDGVVLRHSEEYEKIEGTNEGVVLHLRSGKKAKAACLLWANGRTGNTDKLALENVGLVPNGRGQLAVNEDYQTEVENIYAVGDVIGFPSLASAAYVQGRAAGRHLVDGQRDESLGQCIPTGIYTSPEISCVGQTERELTEQKIPYEVGHAQFKSLARAQITNRPEGMLKLLFHRDTLEVLGVHCFGANASEIIHIGQAILSQKGSANTILYFLSTTFNYPTMAEAYRVAALNGYNRLF
ncbi:MAG: Si-specific NAD(P)(+) transhydrogenase, partial [Pirellulaceae bacterium]|nr:Si-specific NAD(P)(+) transhydrogenase [Pirellulaceae bacterium]